MHIAKNKFGQIGRLKPTVGEEVAVEVAPQVEEHRDVYVSQNSIEKDQARYHQEERANQARLQANRLRVEAIKRGKDKKHQRQAQAILKHQNAAVTDPMNEALKSYFAKRNMMGETEKVVDSLLPPPPADFSSQGGNLDYVPGKRMTGGDQFWADFRQERLVGNPLTRDGVFTPRITDYDRYVTGVDVNQTDVVKIAGGTMLGRYDGYAMNGTMGQTQSWGDWFTKLGQQAGGLLVERELQPKTPSAPQIIEKTIVDRVTPASMTPIYVAAAIIGLGALVFFMRRK